MDVFYYILSPFSWLLNFLYSNLNSYGLSIICFAVVVKIILFPVSVKAKRGMIQMNQVSGKMQQLQKQYGKDKERYNQEVQNLYARENVNPMGGCLWSIIPMFVLIPLYAIIRQPLKYLMGLDETQILQVANALDWNRIAVDAGWMKEQAVQAAMSATASGQVVSGFADTGYNQLYLASLIHEGGLPALRELLGEGSRIFTINFDFFGLNLAALPNWRIWENASLGNLGLVFLVLVSAATGLLFSLITMRTNRLNAGPQSETAERTNRTMMWTMPIMSLWIGFIMPAGLCVYWIANNLLSMVQEFIAGKLLKKDYEAAKVAAEERAKREKEEEKLRKIQAAEERARRLEEEKKNRGKKKPVKPSGEAEAGVNREDSKVGIRAYARGRSYDPNRFGGVTQYRDPSAPRSAAPAPAEEPAAEEIALPPEESVGADVPVKEAAPVPVAIEPAASETEEVEFVEVEVEEIDEDDEEGKS